MKGQDVLMSSGDAEGNSNWETPKRLFDLLDDMYGPFMLDAAATQKNAKCEMYWTSKQDALEQPWYVGDEGAVFCNPPYGRGLDKWIQKGAFEAKRHGIRVVMLVPARVDTIWFHHIVLQQAAAVYFVKGRIQFHLPGRNKRNSATFPSMVLVFDGKKIGIDPPDFYALWQPMKMKMKGKK